jgi:hypothetical protein
VLASSIVNGHILAFAAAQSHEEESRRDTLQSAYAGIDLAIAKRKRLPVSVCIWENGRLIPAPLRLMSISPPRGHGNAAVLSEDAIMGFVEETACYLEQVCELLGVSLKQIAIDAPRSPRDPTLPRRAAESAMDQAGISCFTTPSASEFEVILDKVRRHLAAGGAESRIPHANQLWMLVGFQLFERLATLAPCIEVFPQVTARVLGAGEIHKSNRGGVEAQLSEAARYTGWPTNDRTATRFEDIGHGPAHDRLDAYLSAWVAALSPADRMPFGMPPSDVIWAPKLGSHNFDRPVAKNRYQPPRKASATGSHKLCCPACGSHEFKRWPFGWDAHAAHKCAGVTGRDAGERKADFKKRFGHLFPGKDI